MLKVVKCDLAQNEINIIKMLEHKYVLKYLDDFKSKDLHQLHCLVTEYCEVIILLCLSSFFFKFIV